MSGERVLVTGATGFVGSALVGELMRRGYRVTAAVRRPIPFATGVQVVSVGDVSGTTDWSEALTGCDAVVHCAARVHVMTEVEHDARAAYRVTNADGSARLAEQANSAGVRRFVFISSVKVHGESSQPGQPFSEKDALAPCDPYGISKYEAEVRLRAIASAGSLELVIVRPPLVYGAGVKANFLNMKSWLARGVPLPFGSLTANRRSLVALDNLLDLIATTLTHPAAAHETFLAGDGEDLSTAALLRRTASAMGTTARLIPVPPPLLKLGASLCGRPDLWQRLAGNLQCSIEFARQRLGWRPPVSVDEGLRRAVASAQGDASA